MTIRLVMSIHDGDIHYSSAFNIYVYIYIYPKADDTARQPHEDQHAVPRWLDFFFFVASVSPLVTIPICSMYGIFTYIWMIFRANVGKYTIHGHGASGIRKP